MKTREEIFNEVIELFYKGTTYIIVDITDELKLYATISPFDAFMGGFVWNWKSNKDTETRKFPKTDDFEDDLYYLIDLLIEDAKAVQIV